jgi:hypothetical protein
MPHETIQKLLNDFDIVVGGAGMQESAASRVAPKPFFGCAVFQEVTHRRLFSRKHF